MKKLNRYVFVSFFKPLLMSYFAMTVLVLMAELMERLDKIIAGKAGGWVVAQYLLALWPVRSMELFPIAALLAALFSLGQLSRHMEVTAAMAGGVHPWRVVSPLLTTGVLLSVLTWGLGETLMPWANRQVKNLWDVQIRQLTSRRETNFSNVTASGPDVFYSIGYLDLKEGKMENAVIDRIGPDGPTQQWVAQGGVWTPDGWRLFKGTERFFQKGNELSGQKLFKETQTALMEKPEDLVPKDARPEEMNLRELGQHIRRQKMLGIDSRKSEVERYMKTAMPWSNLIILILGIPFSFNKRAGKVRAVAVALGVAFAYFGLMQVGRAVGMRPWCPPLAGAWMANTIFLVLGAVLFWRMRSLS